jgi:hypothetical protein
MEGMWHAWKKMSNRTTYITLVGRLEGKEPFRKHSRTSEYYMMENTAIIYQILVQNDAQ